MSSSGPGDVFHLVGALLKGTWRVDSFVAQGGFGVVYKGRHERTGRPVAVKVLKFPWGVAGETRAAYVGAFEREAKVLAQLRHEAIVQVLDLSEAPDDDGVMWMVLEWVDGERLDSVLSERRARGGQWTPAACLELLRPLLLALAEAHARGVVHRDLKPANVIVARRSDGAPAPRLLDFGIAKLVDPGADGAPSGDTVTRSDLLAFSPLYAAPEQVAQKRTGTWTDVHAMALILTEMLAGRCAYGERGTDKAVVMRVALDDARPTPAALGVSVGAWEPVLARAMAQAPGARYATAGEFLRALEEALPGATAGVVVAATETLRAVPSVPPPVESTGARTAPTRRRSPVTVGLGGAVVGVALVAAWAAFGRGAAAGRPTARVEEQTATRALAATAAAHVEAATGVVQAPVAVQAPAAAPSIAVPVPVAVDAGAPVVRSARGRGARGRGDGGVTPRETTASAPEPPVEPAGNAPPGGL